MTPAQRLACGLRWTVLTCELSAAGIRRAHPEWGTAQVVAELRRRTTVVRTRHAGSPSATPATRPLAQGTDAMRCEMSALPDELARVLVELEKAGLEYALTGSLASTTWGRPRATYDADILTNLRAADADRLARLFPPPDWRLDRESIAEALKQGGEFNAIHWATATKIDFWLPRPGGVDAARLRRRRQESLAGVRCWLLSPEDVVLAKLEWINAAPSERHQSDVAGILAVQAGQLDLDFLRDQARALGVSQLLAEALAGRSG